jgi:hypothetical protein
MLRRYLTRVDASSDQSMIGGLFAHLDVVSNAAQLEDELGELDVLGSGALGTLTAIERHGLSFAQIVEGCL